MCEENAVDRLMILNFAGLVDEVEGALAFKARNADPRIRPFYSRILYTWYISRGDYRNGWWNTASYTHTLIANDDDLLMLQLHLPCISEQGS